MIFALEHNACHMADNTLKLENKTSAVLKILNNENTVK